MAGKAAKRARRFVIDRYDEFERLVSSIDRLTLLIVVGDGGTGKTEAVRAAAGDRACLLTGRMTAFALYRKLYEHRDGVILLDDVDDLFRDPLAVALLKAACGSQPVRTVQWNSATRQLAEANIPTEFTTTAKFVVITNSWEEVSQNVEALNNRGHLVEFSPTALEVHLKAATFLTAEYQEVFDFFAARLHLIDHPSLRHYLRARESQRAGTIDWRREAASHAFIEGPLLVVAELELDPAFPTVEAKVAEFIRRTEKSRATYFNRKKKLPPPVTVQQITLPEPPPTVPSTPLPEPGPEPEPWRHRWDQMWQGGDPERN
jgi:hypothetical protein